MSQESTPKNKIQIVYRNQKNSWLPAVSSLQLLVALPMPLSDYLSKNIFPGGRKLILSWLHNNRMVWYLIKINRVYKPTSRSLAFKVKLSNSVEECFLDSLTFSNSELKVCTWDNCQSRSSLTCCNSPLREETSVARTSFCFIASSWED